MKYTVLFIVFLVLCSCRKEKVIELPSINYSQVTEIKDVSPAYLFYDITKQDSVELNRKNLISTTNWLINVDKRLTLKQVIPHIIFLQNKKASSSHKNENAKNYYTCNDLSRRNLGFIEFTEINYYLEKYDLNNLKKKHASIILRYYDTDSISIFNNTNNHLNLYKTTNLKTLSNHLEHTFINLPDAKASITLLFNEKTSFEDYILFKSTLKSYKNKSFEILSDEFIY